MRLHQTAAALAPSAEVLKAFNDWSVAEQATHFAAPCPDEIMNALVNVVLDRENDLAAVPAASADDVVLKMFPVFLAYAEPQRGSPPMLPERDCDLHAALVVDLRELSPLLSKLMDTPHRSTLA